MYTQSIFNFLQKPICKTLIMILSHRIMVLNSKPSKRLYREIRIVMWELCYNWKLENIICILSVGIFTLFFSICYDLLRYNSGVDWLPLCRGKFCYDLFHIIWLSNFTFQYVQFDKHISTFHCINQSLNKC